MEKLLHISDDYSLEMDKVIGKCIGIMGIRGSGKTNTASVILEELLSHNYPMTIIDIDGEYWGLKQNYELLVVGNSDNADIHVSVEHAREIADVSLSSNIPIILDMSGFLHDETYEFLLEYLDEIWKKAGAIRKPYEIILEEAHEWIPQGSKNELKQIITRIALRGRKRGLGIIIISQRSAKVEKDVLTQAEILFLHKVVHPTDMKVYREILPLLPKEVTKQVSRLSIGQCIMFYKNLTRTVKIREQKTYHAGFTPSLKNVEAPKLKEISKDIFNTVEELTKTKKEEKTKIEKLERKIIRLEGQLSEKDSYIQKIESDIETISRIKIEVKQPEIANITKAIVTELITPNTKDGPGNIDNLLNINRDNNEEAKITKQAKEHIDRIITKIKILAKSNQEMLKFLINRYPETYTINDIAQWIDYSESTLQSNVPSILLSMGIIKRTRKPDGYHYSSNLENFVKEQFEIYYTNRSGGYVEMIYNCLKSRIENMGGSN